MEIEEDCKPIINLVESETGIQSYPRLSSEVLEVIRNITIKCLRESENNEIDIPLTNIMDRVFSYTGVDCTNSQYLEKLQSCILVNTSINIVERIKIYLGFKKFMNQGISPSVENLYDNIGIYKSNISLPQFRKELNWMGFDLRIIKNKKILMEDPKLAFARYLYLKKVKKMRHKVPNKIYYMEVRTLDLNLEFKKPQKILASDSKLKNVFIYLMSENNGYENGLTLKNATPEEVELWITTVVLEKLATNSYIVIDNNPLFASLHTLNVSKYSSRDEMSQWLKQNNIPFSEYMHKAELYELIKQYPKKESEYKIDMFLKRNGHSVLRLPNKLQDLTPTEELWGYIRRAIAADSPLPVDMTSLESKMREKMTNLPQPNWKKNINSVISQESILFDIEDDAKVSSD